MTETPDLPPRRHRGADRAAPRADPGARRRDGHDDPGPPARRGRLPRRAVRRLTERPARQQRPALADPARRSSRGIHRAYLEAGADIIETNTFNAHRDLAGRLRHGGPRLRAERRGGPPGPRRVRRDDRARRPTGRATSPARSARPTAPRRSRPTSTTPARATSPSTSSSRPTSSRPAAWSTAAPTCCSSRRSSTPSTPRPRSSPLETLFEEHGRRWPVIDLRHDHRRLRPHPVRPGHRGVLELGPARPAARRRPQLRARRRRRCAPTSPSCRASPTASSPATPTPACPTRSASTTRRRTHMAGVARRVRRRAAWSTSSAAAAAPRPSTSPPSPTPSRASPRAPCRRVAPALRLSGPRAADHHRGVACSSTSASAPTSPARPASATSSRTATTTPRSSVAAPAGRGRRAGHRRQHGRGDDRRRRRDGPLPQADRLRARHLPGAGDGRLLKWEVIEAGLQVRAGQGDRQLHLDEGGRGEVPSSRPGCAASTARPPS